MTKKIIITGGCGFIGTNTSLHFLKNGYEVISIDNLSRKGIKNNLEILSKFPKFTNYNVDISNYTHLFSVLSSTPNTPIIHLAAQVAVTTSILNPALDFHTNALGTFNLLEVHRNLSPLQPFINISTNKVYGKLKHLKFQELPSRYSFEDSHLMGINELQSLNFDSPYGCSKGSADQFAIDYATTYGLRTITLRQSCIYGDFQYGVEDQGWIAWFIIARILNIPLTIYGSGKQVRDILHVQDLVRLYEILINNPSKLNGQPLNIGGGVENSLSLLELLDYLEKQFSLKNINKYNDIRLGDQPLYISDISKVKSEFNWSPTINKIDGIHSLYNWISVNIEKIKSSRTVD